MGKGKGRWGPWILSSEYKRSLDRKIKTLSEEAAARQRHEQESLNQKSQIGDGDSSESEEEEDDKENYEVFNVKSMKRKRQAPTE